MAKLPASLCGIAIALMFGLGRFAQAASMRPMGPVPLGDASVRAAQESFDACLQTMSGPARARFLDRSARRTPLTGRARSAWQRCRTLERDLDDAAAGVHLAHAISRLQPEPSAAAEAAQLAAALVAATRTTAERYRMLGSPLFNNFLIALKVKKRGYCYHWTEALLKALPAERLRYFERRWGGANVGRATENNAVIITARGAPVEAGIVYDAWRGAGRPWWRQVEADHYRWTERYSETEILLGSAMAITTE
ncbi:MAG: hypothetical protein HY543_01940 [Deltaproteobacteria bacterium]|nr:hypothetical protein [Deltaproteobacteria bacterium]